MTRVGRSSLSLGIAAGKSDVNSATVSDRRIRVELYSGW